MVARGQLVISLLQSGDMSDNLKKLSGSGQIQDAINRLVDAVRSQKPQSSPGMLTNWTTRGVTRTPVGEMPVSNSVQELQVAEVYDDFLACESEADRDPSSPIGSRTYVLKPPTLSCSYWKPGWNFGNKPDFTVGAHPRALVYADASSRWRIKFDSEQSFNNRTSFAYESGRDYMRQHNLASYDDATVVDYTYIREIIYPVYSRPYSDANGNSSTDVSKVFAIPIGGSAVTTQQLNSFGEIIVPAGIPINLIDLNIDARSWQPLHIMLRAMISIHGNVGPINTRFLPDRFIDVADTQRDDQLFGAAPTFVSSFYMTQDGRGSGNPISP